jgi:pyruvate kinase
MIRAGMNVARLNFSHGDHAEHRKRMEMLHEVSADLGANVALMLDTKGVEIRTGRMESGVAHLTTGERFTLHTEERRGNARGASISYPDLPREVEPGSAVLIDDGVIELRVMTPENRADLLFAIEHDIAYVAASFVRDGADLRQIRRFMDEHHARVSIIAKIESAEGVNNLDDIVAQSDGIMVARGDLGVEIPLQILPTVQKKIIRTTVMNGKPVITATQMLDSMQRSPMPTRAEVSDVANAIFDGTSAVMLSGETAAGAYPVEAVRTMAALAIEAEASLEEYGHLQQVEPEPSNVVTEAVAQASITMARHLNAAAILALTESGFTARSISKYRPSCPILGITASHDVVRRFAMNWGVTGVECQRGESNEEMVRHGISRGLELGFLESGDLVVATAGMHGGTGTTDMIRVVYVD